ncbi:conjugal transfer protein TraD [Sphingomonas sp. HF-S3]|uniref:Conjugal transfer protein TraD n=1 Tax=Sphingomonas rustica TaxID=3103142 RepID=A0ABV0BDB0_9SPHN
MLPSFAVRDPLAKALAMTRNQARRMQAARNRMQAVIARHDKRSWVVKRRERTRQLIELGGLVVKSGLVELTEDDRSVILGILVEAGTVLNGHDAEQKTLLWRRRGRRAFDGTAADKTAQT